MDIYDALKLLATRSEDASREAIRSLRAPEATLALRYLQVLDLAFSDPNAHFTVAEREALVGAVQTVTASARGYVLHIRLTDSERAELAQLASEAGVTPSEYVRSRLF